MTEIQRHPFNLTLALTRTLRQDVHDLCDAPLRTILPDVKDPDALELFSKVLHRWNLSRIKLVPRRVYLSERLRRNKHYAQYAKRLDEIRAILEAGSARINDPDEHFLGKDYYKPVHRDNKGKPRVKYDLLLHEWSIYHFHLGETGGAPELLYGIVLQSDVLMIDIWGHGLDFSNAEILEAAKAEWPTLFDGVGLPGVSGNKLAPEQIKNLRTQNASYCIDVGGVAFVPFGAFTVSGTPVTVRWNLDMIASVIRELEVRLTDPDSDTRRSLAETLGKSPRDLDLRVVDHSDNFKGLILLYDESSGKGIRLSCEALTFPWRHPPLVDT